MPGDTDLPLKPVEETPRPLLAPPWVALLCPWLGLLMVAASVVFIFLPGTTNPRAELTRQQQFSLADRFLPWPLYGITVTLFICIVVLWQMRKEPRPLPEALVAQRVQAFAGIALALIATVVIYVHVGLRGPG